MIQSGNTDLSRKIKDFALSTGFDMVGIARSKPLTEHKGVLEKWISSGMNADMNFISRDLNKRTDPGLLLDEARSVVVTGTNYYPPVKQGGNGIPVISKYAYGKDYHTVIREKLNSLLEFIVSCQPGVSGRVCVDSEPVLEKAWAREAGLGSIGKNSVLINKEAGSFLFLGEIILNIELEYDSQFTEDLCKSCRRCLDACPTNAINDNKTIDARKCISWLTVENKKPIPEEFRGKLGNRVFGCDACQDVCPWNKDPEPHNNPELAISEELARLTAEEWFLLSREKFTRLFSLSPVGRQKYERLIRNIETVLKNRS